MGKYTVNGGKRLSGEIKVQGAKNAVLPILSAAIVTGRHSVIQNCPDIEDVRNTVTLMRGLGCEVSTEKNTIEIDSRYITETNISTPEAGKMRSSVLFAGAVLGRCGEVTIRQPGVCANLKKVAVDYLSNFAYNIRLKDNYLGG